MLITLNVGVMKCLVMEVLIIMVAFSLIFAGQAKEVQLEMMEMNVPACVLPNVMVMICTVPVVKMAMAA